MAANIQVNRRMKLLLTSGGLTNKSIKDALRELVGKPYADTKIAFIPTAAFAEGHDKGWLIDDMYRVKETGAYVDIIDIAQLPKNELFARLEEADVIFVGGGNSFYLSYQMEQSGLMEQLPKLLESRVYVGISAGSMIVSDSLRVSSQALAKGKLSDEEYGELGPEGRSSAKTAKLVKFVVRPHLNSRSFPKITGEYIKEVARELHIAVYAVDDQSAVKVINDKIEVISEGEWKLYG